MIVDRIRSVFEKAYPVPMTGQEVCEKTKANSNTVRGTIGRLVRTGELENVQPGFYKWVPVSLRAP